MTKEPRGSIGAPHNPAKNWDFINWRKVEGEVKRMQMRIAKAIREGKYGKAKSLQWMLTHSFTAKALAVRNVTENRGQRTPGIDGEIWRNKKQKMNAIGCLGRKGYRPQPLRRIYIPKKNGKKRPLSIPTMRDRSMQALHALALKPVAESIADRNSYGFREGRCCADAISQCFNVLSKWWSPGWVLEADIESCFDKISHEWLLSRIPMDRDIQRKWLQVGYMEERRWYPSPAGTPQGGIISPLLANLTLDGLEKAVADAIPQGIRKVNMIRYADDFIITGPSRELLEEQVKPALQKFLAERGLTLSESKTRITQIDEGFNFLGQNIRKYRGKLLITPAKANVKAFRQKVGATIRANLGVRPEKMIGELNPILRGWANYHRHIVAKRRFASLDFDIGKALFAWAHRRHPKKSAAWVKRKYFTNANGEGVLNARIADCDGKKRVIQLYRLAKTVMQWHIKVKAEAHPYHPAYQEYFERRKCFAWKVYSTGANTPRETNIGEEIKTH
jgi:RNA-directed DNA polymerase